MNVKKLNWKVIFPILVVLILVGIITLFFYSGGFKALRINTESDKKTEDVVIGEFEKPTGNIDQSVDAILNYTDDEKIISQEDDSKQATQMDEDVSGAYNENYENYTN